MFLQKETLEGIKENEMSKYCSLIAISTNIAKIPETKEGEMQKSHAINFCI